VKLAITGGTGFVGAHLIDLSLAEGHELRALTRRPQPPRPGIEWIEGPLSDRAAVARLVEGADAVVHVAGVINAPDAASFEEGNVGGTLAAVAAATASGARRFVHVSSLAAREPELSQYGASKARAEALVENSGLDWVIVRPPAVYGPGDKETLELFKMARLGLMVLPPKGRLSLIHVDDLARLLLALTAPGAPSQILVEADDGRARGWSHREFALALGEAVERRPLTLAAPSVLLRLGAKADQLVRGAKAKLTADRAAYFAHDDWVIDPSRRPPAALWRPAIDTVAGVAATARWYRAQGWL
jgi:nucleoside-diphosphate-sugar epimerase